MDPAAAAPRQALERMFNALWRAHAPAGRRLSRVCRRGSAYAVIALPTGAELLAPVRGITPFGLLRTGLPYYVRLPASAAAERVDSPEELLALLADETELRERLQGHNGLRPANERNKERTA